LTVPEVTKKTLKEQISELYDRDCYGYMRVVRPEEIFKVVDGLVAELQKRATELRLETENCDKNNEHVGFICYLARGEELQRVLGLLGVKENQK